MTQEDKKLLLKDLCARLPYKTLISIDGDGNRYRLEEICHAIIGIDTYKTTVENCNIEQVKPYLFPLSSMTEEQQEEFDRIYADDMQVVANNLKNRLDGKPYERNLGHYRHIDWLNANHFDYRGLISKGLAIDATGLNIY